MPFHWGYLVVILVLALIIFGPSRLPELGNAAGKAIKEFRKASAELRDDVVKASETPSDTASKTETPAAKS